MGFFKAYDMRGTFGTDFGLDTVRRVGLALPQVVKGRRWLVGRDGRTTSDAVRDALVRGLTAAGAEVTDIGLCTTPMVYYFTAEDGYDGSVMITASHNPPTDNGLKVSMKTALPVGYANGLAEVERLVGQTGITGTSQADETGGAGGPAVPGPDRGDHARRYLGFLRSAFGRQIASGLRIGVDCSNGMSSLLVHELFPSAEIINDTIDGTFPAHSPNPLDPKAREQLAALVREKRLDCGVIFDGDADRAMFVDEKGDFVQPDYLIPLVARSCLADRANVRPVVLHDVRTSRGTIETLREDGFEPVMVPVGHAFAKPKMRELGALCGGELAGHYYFGDFFGCDSGLIAALRILGEFARSRSERRSEELVFSKLLSPIVSRYANSGELNFRVEDKDAAIARVLADAASLGVETGRSEIDGFRVEFADGWFNVRKSNTEPYLRLIVEARTPALLADWISQLRGAIQ